MLKAPFLTVILFLTPGVSISFAKIWRVNNNVGIAADFTTIQAAHDGAASGNTIYLEGSCNSYGGVSYSNKLYI